MPILSNGNHELEAYKITGITSGEFKTYHGCIIGRDSPTFILEDYEGDKFKVDPKDLDFVFNNHKKTQLWAVVINNKLVLSTEVDLYAQGYLGGTKMSPRDTLNNIKARFADVVSRIEMPGLEVFISEPVYITYNDSINKTYIVDFYMQVKCDGTCNVTGKPQKWSGRKWKLSEHMTDQEIVQTALKAVLTAYEHEIREQFKYRGVSVFDPHYDIEKLVELRKQPDSVVERKKASTVDMVVQGASRVERTTNIIIPKQLRHLVPVIFKDPQIIPWLYSHVSKDDIFYYTEICETQHNCHLILKTEGHYSLSASKHAAEYVLSKIHNCKKAYLGVHAKHKGEYTKATVGFLFSELSELVG